MEYLKRLTERYNYSLETYYMALSLIDKIFINNNETRLNMKNMKFELVAIGCFLLAGNS